MWLWIQTEYWKVNKDWDRRIKLDQVSIPRCQKRKTQTFVQTGITLSLDLVMSEKHKLGTRLVTLYQSCNE
jgi:hypothetical protein